MRGNKVYNYRSKGSFMNNQNTKVGEINIKGEKIIIESDASRFEELGMKDIFINTQYKRILISEIDFHKFVSTVFRSYEEFYRQKKSYKQVELISTEPEEISNCVKEEAVLQNISKLFKDEGINFKVLDINEKLVTILMNPNDKEKFDDINKEFKKHIHPFGMEEGYRFLYGMSPFELIEYENVFIEIFFQLPCLSLTPKTWIPLEQIIHRDIWKENTSSLLYEIRIVYILTWGIFFKKSFNKRDKKNIKGLMENVNKKVLKKYLEKIFFNYTESIIKSIENNRLNQIVAEYYANINY